jgi:NADPH:quinone reductase-like Zn-dependent oxidoreductase
MKAYELKPDAKGLDDLIAVERPEPKAGAGEVVIRVRAASLNARDQGVAAGRYRGGAVTKPTIPLSDGAGEVIAVGPGVTRVKLGDRVMHTFRKNWIDGPYHPNHIGETMGLPLDGMLAEQVAASEQDCVAVPDHLSDEEAACLPCAGVTAWHALMEKKALRPGETVLLIGTGGVAIFGLQFAKLAGAKAIVVSSSDQKLARARELGADGGVNYKTHADWEKEVLRLTGGRGVDHVVEVGGATLPRSIASLAIGGHIHAIGFVAGQQPSFTASDFVRRDGHLDGIMVGSRAMFERMNAAISAAKMKPVVDKIFTFQTARLAYEYQRSPDLFGKVVITI